MVSAFHSQQVCPCVYHLCPHNQKSLQYVLFRFSSAWISRCSCPGEAASLGKNGPQAPNWTRREASPHIHVGNSWGFVTWARTVKSLTLSLRATPVSRIPEMTQFIKVPDAPKLLQEAISANQDAHQLSRLGHNFSRQHTQAGRRSAADKQMLFPLLFSLNSRHNHDL